MFVLQAEKLFNFFKNNISWLVKTVAGLVC